jgi:hypothetical protein
MKSKHLLIFLFSFTCLFPILSKSQSIGDYRTAGSGNWSSASTWDMYNGLIWTSALLPPSSLNGAITIRNGHTVTVTANTTVDDVTINTGGTLLLAANTLTLDILGLGDLVCNGSLQVSGGDLNMSLTNTVTVNGSMLWTDGDVITGTINVNNGGTLTLNSAATKDLQSATININSGGTMNWDDGNINLNILGGINNSGTINTSCNASISGLGILSIGSMGIFSKSSTGTTTFNVIVNNLFGGSLRGIGTYDFNNLFVNLGTIAPGFSPGIVLVSYSELDPNYLLAPSSDIDIEIKDGTGPGTGHDQVIKDGDLRLGGTLRVTETGTVPDGVYNIVLVSGAITGAFDNVILPPGYSLTVTTSIVLVSKNTGVLPVALANFTAKQINNTVQLNWQTYSESNSDHFDVERSIPGGQFMKIGEVNAAGNSNQLVSYQFLDNNPVKGTNLFRLKQVDKDNKFEYSTTRWMRMDDKKNELYIFPTITSSALFVLSNEKTIVELYDLRGVTLLIKEINGNEQIDLSKFGAGIYLLRNRKDGKTFKIVKK